MHDTPTTQTTDRPTALEKLAQPEGSNIKRVIAVMSGKGGVGKSSVSALLASALARRGHKTALLDADITGPSIPKLFGLKTLPSPVDSKLLPAKSSLGISVMSLNFLLENEDDPVIWRGPLIAGAVKQFWTDVIWGEVDYMVVDLPPGTGDVPLTALQSLPLDRFHSARSCRDGGAQSGQYGQNAQGSGSWPYRKHGLGVVSQL